MLEVEGVLQDHQIVAQVGVVDAHELLVLLELVVGLTHLQLQGAQLIGVGVALLLQACAGSFHRGRAGEVEQGVVELQARLNAPFPGRGRDGAAVGHIKRAGRGDGCAAWSGGEDPVRRKHGAKSQIVVGLVGGGGAASTLVAAVGKGADGGPIAAHGGLNAGQGSSHLLPLGLQGGAVGKGDGQSLLQAEAGDAAGLELLGGG